MRMGLAAVDGENIRTCDLGPRKQTFPEISREERLFSVLCLISLRSGMFLNNHLSFAYLGQT